MFAFVVVLVISVAVIGIHILVRKKPKKDVINSESVVADELDGPSNSDSPIRPERNTIPAIEAEVIPQISRIDEEVTEIITDNKLPAFKYRFIASLDVSTPSEVLKKHRSEEFIERLGGNRDTIVADFGVWMPVTIWNSNELFFSLENEKFKYIGGVENYIKFLLVIRSVYEDMTRSPQSKKAGIKKVCEDNKDAYAVQYFYLPPWESLIVPVFSLAEGFGPHRVGLLDVAGIRSINDVEIRSDKELLAIKGIGKVAVSSLRHFVSNWSYDKFTDCIEKDAEYRTVKN